MNKWMVGLGALVLTALITVGAQGAAPKVDGKIDAKEYANSFKHTESGVTINWQIVGDAITFGLESPSTGWTGLGFNPTGDKKQGADMYMFLFEDGKLVARDEVMTTSTGAPKQDTDQGGKNDILASAGTLGDKGMVIEWSRKLNTGDKTDQPILAGKTNKVLLALGDSPSFTKAHKRGDRWELEIVLK
jgi:DOMON domain